MRTQLTTVLLPLVALIVSGAMLACGDGSKGTRERGDPDQSADLTLDTAPVECYDLSQESGQPVVVTSDGGDLIQPSITQPAPTAAATAETTRDVLKPCK